MRKQGINRVSFKQFTDSLCEKYNFISHSEYEMEFDCYHYHFSNDHFVIYIRYSKKIEDCKIMCKDRIFMEYKNFKTMFDCADDFVNSIFKKFN